MLPCPGIGSRYLALGSRGRRFKGTKVDSQTCQLGYNTGQSRGRAPPARDPERKGIGACGSTPRRAQLPTFVRHMLDGRASAHVTHPSDLRRIVDFHHIVVLPEDCDERHPTTQPRYRKPTPLQERHYLFWFII